MNKIGSEFFSRVKNNWLSGLTVSLVSLPLSLALAIASGATPTQGIITALWAGLFCAIFGGSHFNIVGPTGALSGILIVYVFTHDAMSLSFIALLSGVLIFLAFLFKLDRYIIFIPRSVIHGFTLGVAALIALGQVDNALGLSGVEKTSSVVLNAYQSFLHIAQANSASLLFFVCGLILIFVWNKKFIKIPGAIVLAALGIITSLLLNAGILSGFYLPTIASQYPDLSSTIFLNIFSTFDVSLFFDLSTWSVSFAVAIVAILETLLSGQIAYDKTKLPFDRRKEVLGLSIGNIVSGLVGGIPATAALARTSLNIKSGAKSRYSAILSSVFLLALVLLFINYFRVLPLVVVASILVYVAISMVEKHHFIKLLSNEKIAFGVSLIVAGVTLIIDPIAGILIGTIIALLIFAQEVSKGKSDIQFWKNGSYLTTLQSTELSTHHVDSDIVIYRITGTLTYINMPAHIDSIKLIKGNKHVIISLRHAFYADSDGIDYLGELITILKRHNDDVVLSGINAEIKKKIRHEPFYTKKFKENKIFNRSEDALKHFNSLP